MYFLAFPVAPASSALSRLLKQTSQALHWKQKPAGKKPFCVTPEERWPANGRTEQATPTYLKEESRRELPRAYHILVRILLRIFLLPHFHVPCAGGLRPFGIAQLCPMFRDELSSKPEQLFERGLQDFLFPRLACCWAQRFLLKQGDGHPGPVARTMNKFIRSFKVAADQGHTRAQFILGLICYKGQIVPQSYEGALERFRKAADQGNVDAKFSLATMYEKPHGCSRAVSQSSRPRK